jgi:hypothetical protein
MFTIIPKTILLLSCLVYLIFFLSTSKAFTTIQPSRQRQYQQSIVFQSISTSSLKVSKLRDGPASTSANMDDDYDDDEMTTVDDETLLRQTKRSQLVDLCEQFDLSTNGTKEELLLRLREYAQIRIQEETRRLKNRKQRVEEGSGDERERHEIVGEEDGDDDEQPYVYFESKEDFSNYGTEEDTDKKQKPIIPTTRESLLAPPPPDIEPNENGERVVTVYSTTDHNDLTGVAAAQPREAVLQDPMTGTIAEPENAPWDLEKQQKQKSSTTTAEIDAAKEEVTELVSSLLKMTGAPGFQSDDDDDDGDDLLKNNGIYKQKFQPGTRTVSSFETPNGFSGFDPTKVSTDVVAKASKSIRLGRGRVLQDVIREFELRAVGYDGAAGDDKDRGGGHYQQVSMIRSFLEGFRRAEVRRLARETATLLLDRLVTDGIEGLDIQ